MELYLTRVKLIEYLKEKKELTYLLNQMFL